jgi:transcriptional regulator GlxA family with amidase domain
MVGPRLESLRIPVFPGTTYIGVRLNPGASGSVLGWPGERLTDYVGLLAPVNADLGLAFASIAKRASSLDDAAPDLTRLLSEHLAAAPPPDEMVLAAAAALTVSKGTAKSAEIAARSGIGARQFQRRFKREVGLTPKQFARVCRVRAAAVDVVMNQAGDWGQVAVERGFADQSHLVREFAHIFGMTPSEFSRTFAPGIEHVDVG